MTEIIKKYWGLNANLLREKIENLESIDELSYEDIVKMSFKTIFNGDYDLDLENMHVIDDGDYQGTLLFMIPEDRYQPGPGDYILTYIYYGSCSGCDTLQAIQADDDRNRQNVDMLILCKDILCNATKPYNSGWRMNSEWEEVDMDE